MYVGGERPAWDSEDARPDVKVLRNEGYWVNP